MGLLGSTISFTGPLPHETVLRLLAYHGYGVALFPRTPLLDEGVPLKLLEYAAIGLPLVTTSTTLVGKLAGRKRAGIVVEPEARPEEVAEKIEAILSIDENEYWEMSLNARRLAGIFDVEKLAKREAECITDAEE